ncbi:MAG: hypothetical protein HQL05_14295 [Nitrospirae bacterium]|nr:hypothetical protein [Nitrospirota bacterium]
MPATIKQEHDIGLIRVTQHVTDGQGLRIAAIVDIRRNSLIFGKKPTSKKGIS